MVNWQQGGWTGSVRRLVRNEVKMQLRTNLAYRRVRYGFFDWLFRKFFHTEKFSRYITLYFFVDVFFAAAEALLAKGTLKVVPDVHVVLSAPLDFSQSLLTNVSGYFVAAQAGVLGIIALALALVSLIAQRENSTTGGLIRVWLPGESRNLNWQQGGWTGSVRRLVRNEVKMQLRTLFRKFFHTEKFSRYITLYFFVSG